MIGTGGYSIVKVAQNKKTDEPVAIKIIKKWELSRRQLKQILREAEVLSKLRHEHILGFVECIQDEDFLCIITEWLSMDTYDYININFDELMERDIKLLFH